MWINGFCMRYLGYQKFTLTEILIILGCIFRQYLAIRPLTVEATSIRKWVGSDALLLLKATWAWGFQLFSNLCLDLNPDPFRFWNHCACTDIFIKSTDGDGVFAVWRAYIIYWNEVYRQFLLLSAFAFPIQRFYPDPILHSHRISAC